MPRKKAAAPIVHDEDVEDEGAIAVVDTPQEPAEEAPRRRAKHADPDPDDLPAEDVEFLKAISVGAVKDVIIPKVALEASDWCETIGRTMKTAMETSPNGVKIDVTHVKRARDGSYYAITIREAAKGSAPATATIETREWLYMRDHNKKGLGKWFRRIGNALLDRDANT